MTKSPTADQLPPPGPSNVVYREPSMFPIRPHMVWVKCPHCGKKYTRATAGSTVEVACRGCKEVTIVALIAA
jgi:hypothetical protein